MSADRTSDVHTRTVGTGGDEAGTVVFLHGLLGQGRNFTTVAKALQPELTSVLVDLPDHGRSAWTECFDYAAVADRVAAQLRAGAAASGPVHLVGHSLGGKVAMVLALRHLDLVRRLVVVDISPVASTEAGQFAPLLEALAGLDLPSLPSRASADEQLRVAVPDLTVRGFLLQNLHRDHGAWAWRANLRLLRESLETIAGFPDLGDRTYDGPVLWVAGQHSAYVQDEHAAPMRALFPRTVAVTVKDAGHWVHSEQPAAFSAVLRRFLLPA